NNPVHIEIGSGRGEFLLKKAEQNPQINFVGIDLKDKRIKTILRKLDEDKHNNVRLMRIFINNESIAVIPSNSIARIYLIYPDPWPKKRHFKRRIINQAFIDVLKKVLRQNGVIEISTDHADYANWIVEHFQNRDDFMTKYEGGFSRQKEENHIVTYFEDLKRIKGFEPYFMRFRRE
ncbi:MAG: tRNA (guanosine(46)-N7)-methyltransferase TrmB, partial [Candidatus Cloacimonetes bacterium]|nr:tRNA (guanosine(46)-N7)-methyltransferase TrmB [Candidatus Cloacimonadota bacterium]